MILLWLSLTVLFTGFFVKLMINTYGMENANLFIKWVL